MGRRSARWDREFLLRHSTLLRFDRAALPGRNHCRRNLRPDARRNLDDAKRRHADVEWETSSGERACRARGSCHLGGAFKNRRHNCRRSAPSPRDGASRAQMPVDGKRGARHGVCGVRTIRRLHRTGHQPLGYRGGMDSGGNGGRHSGDETAHRHERQIQHRRVERRDRSGT